jgi:hypothetical protein
MLWNKLNVEDPTSPTTKLNIWACTIGGGILGYAQFPGGSSATDGIVIDSNYFGLSSAASYPYNLENRFSWSGALDEPTSHLGRRYVWKWFSFWYSFTTQLIMVCQHIHIIALVLVLSRDDNELHGLHWWQRHVYVYWWTKKKVDALFVSGGPRAAGI